MQKSIFFRRVLALLLLALMLWAVLTGLSYRLISKSVFTQIKVNELQPKAESIANMAAQSYLKHDPYFSELLDSAYDLFDVWIFVVDGLTGEFRNTALPAESALAEPEIQSMIRDQSERLLSGDYASLWFTDRLRTKNSGDMLFIGVPIKLVFRSQTTVIGTVFFVQPMTELNAGLNSMNIALLVSSLLVLLLMIIPVYFATARLIRPLKQTRDVALAMASGDFGVRANVSQKGEIGELAMTMNNLASDLSRTISDLILERNRLKQIIDGMNDGLIAFDPKGHYTQANQAAWSLLGLDQAIQDEEPVDPLAAFSTLSDAYHEAIRKSKPVTCMIETGGRMIRAQINPLVLSDDQMSTAGAVALFHDITESERLEQTRRDYVANVSHELRSPLTAMRALIEPLSDGLVTDEKDRHRYYSILLNENIRLTHLIDDMLELSRLQAGTLSMQKEAFSLNGMLQDLLLKYQPQADEKGLALQVADNMASCPVVLGDPDRIEQVLVILIDNAMKFTPSGGQINVSADWNEKQVQVHVSDTGIGIDPADMKHIFDRFYKADRAHQQPGTGLGLSIAQEILRQMGQSIRVRSQPGRGSVFSFTLSRADKDKNTEND